MLSADEMMKYAIQFCFTENDVRELCQIFESINSPVTARGDRPHLTLALFNTSVPAEVCKTLDAISLFTSTFPMTFSAIGLFPTAENVVYLSPTVTIELLELHRRLHNEIQSSASSSSLLYSPQHWVPHVAISIGIADEKRRILDSLGSLPVWKTFTLVALEFIQISPGKLLHRVELQCAGDG